LRHQPRNFENVTLVARWRKHFRGVLVIFLVAQFSAKSLILVYKNSFASCQFFLLKKNAPQARLNKQNALQAGFFDFVLMGTLSY